MRSTSITFKTLARQIRGGLVASFELHSSDPMVYVAYCCFEGRRLSITDAGRFGSRFPSRYAAYAALREVGVDEVTFIHRSAYGEMIGLEGCGQSNEYREVVDLRAFEA